jgi:hypothetical protein
LVSAPASAVDGLADDVGVAGVTSGLLDHVYRNHRKFSPTLSDRAHGASRSKFPKISFEAAICSR